MPLYKKYTRSNYRNKMYFKKKPGNIFWHRLHNKVKYLSRFVNTEEQYKDYQQTLLAVSGTPHLLSICDIGQGDAVSDRQGDSIKVTKLQMKYYIEQGGSATQTQIRIMLILDKQANGALPSVGDFLLDASVDDQLVSLLNLDNKFRFIVLYDRLITLSSSGTRTIGGKVFKKMQTHIRYSGTTNSTSNIQSNNYFLYIASNETSTNPSITYMLRVKYVDN